MKPPRIRPDTRDWTFVIENGCEECGFSPDYDVAATGDRLRATVPRYQEALQLPKAATRSGPQVWSSLEYSCHARDVLVLFRERLRLMLEHDDPALPSWDQDEAAVQHRYSEQDLGEVAAELAREAEGTAASFDAVPPDRWQRTGRRSDGSAFTVRTLAIYCLHDIVHHANDVHCGPR